jgi:hypothetical protein
LVVHVSQLAAKQEASEEVKRGPPKTRAFDETGKPTKALLGFCKGCGADPATLRFEADKKVSLPIAMVPLPSACDCSLEILAGFLLATPSIPCGFSVEVAQEKVRRAMPTH